MDDVAKVAEILVLRHQLRVLRRQVARPRFKWSDRAVIAPLSGLEPRQRWPAFLVTPKTVLDWTAASSDDTGPTPTVSRAAPGSRPRPSNSSAAWPGRIPDGDTCASSATWQSSASPC